MRPLLFLALLAATGAHAWTEPERGTQLRSDMIDAVRPRIEWDLGAPVEFVVWELRVQGDVGFASLWAQRPGGGDIDLYTSPAAQRQQLDPDVGDGPTVQALLQRSGRTWVAVHYGISATDVWWDWDGFCPIWAPVIPETCSN